MADTDYPKSDENKSTQAMDEIDELLQEEMEAPIYLDEDHYLLGSLEVGEPDITHRTHFVTSLPRDEPATSTAYFHLLMDQQEQRIKDLTLLCRSLALQQRSTALKFAELKREISSQFAIQSLGVDLNEVPLERIVPVRIYISENDPLVFGQIRTAVEKVLEESDLRPSDEFPLEYGSIFGRFLFKSKEFLTSDEVVQRLQKVERAIEVEALHKPQSEANKNDSEAVANLIKSFEGTPNAVGQIGSILIVKHTCPKNGPWIVTKTLTANELVMLERNLHWLKNPADILERLSALESQVLDMLQPKVSIDAR